MIDGEDSRQSEEAEHDYWKVLPSERRAELRLPTRCAAFLYEACVAMLSSRFLPLISSFFKPGENIQCTCATPPLPAASLEVEAMCTQVYTHKGMHSHTQLLLG